MDTASAGDTTQSTESRACTACGETKPVTEYYRNRSLKTGRFNRCRACVRGRICKARAAVNDPETERQLLRRIWCAMRQRCNNPGHKAYRYYGGRGIRVCERWETSFEAFLEDMGPRPPGLTLDRLDNDRGYEPSNCAWRSRVEQGYNRRMTHLEFCGRKLSVAQWSREIGVDVGRIRKRLKKGWPIARVLTRGGVQAPQRGEEHGGAKLTAADVVEIRRRRREEGVSPNRLAKEFRVSATQVRKILRGEAWGHL